jgi:O-antigen biosynthesis protein
MVDEPQRRLGADVERPHVLAFYLPQFHQVPENDAWHGRGFTEWTVVARSKPLYPGHRQPHLPGELGFYDLRVPETRYRQARLAREHGITGFLYYHYWFSGKRMLGRPLDEVLASGQPDFPFALCWANESWFRRWQGSVDEVLVQQEFTEEDDLAHIRWLIGCFKDPRYIRIGGRPLLAVYRAQDLPEPERTVELWGRECEAAGVERPWLVMFETGEEAGAPSQFGFDAGAEFVPHRLPHLLDESYATKIDRRATMYGFDDVAAAYLSRPPVDWQRYPCVATGWDNSPRRQAGEAFILRDATPESYGRWLGQAVERQAESAGRDGIVFVNAWNEWAEGAHLEPDTHWGRAYLETTREVMLSLFDAALESALTEPQDAAATSAEDRYRDLYEQFVVLQKARSGILSYADRRISERERDFERLLAESREETRKVAEMNEELAQRLRLLAARLRELGDDVPAMPWLVTS